MSSCEGSRHGHRGSGEEGRRVEAAVEEADDDVEHEDDAERHHRRRGGDRADTPRRSKVAGAAVLLGSIAAAGSALGVLTVYGQLLLPAEIGSLANSSGSWSLAAFLLARRAGRPLLAAACGAIALFGLLVGYVVGADVRGFPSSMSLIVFWGIAALSAGPALGLAARWVESGHRVRMAFGAAAMSGVVVGEGAWALSNVAGTTDARYWWGQIVVGAAVLGWVAVRRLRSIRLILSAALLTVLVSGAFTVVYGLDLIALL